MRCGRWSSSWTRSLSEGDRPPECSESRRFPVCHDHDQTRGLGGYGCRALDSFLEVFALKFSTTEQLTDVELVARILGRQTDDMAVTRLATATATDGWIGGMPLAEAARPYGSVGPRSLAKLEAAIELGRRTLAARAARQAETITTPEDVVRLMKPLLVGKDREHFFCAALSTKNRLLKIIEVSIGSLNSSIVHPRELFREVISVSAASVVIVHNHPSGDSQPSSADIQLTRRLARAGEVLGVEVLDHVVIGGDSHASLREMGVL